MARARRATTRSTSTRGTSPGRKLRASPEPGTGAGAGKVTLTDLEFTTNLSSTTESLFENLLAGRTNAGAVLSSATRERGQQSDSSSRPSRSIRSTWPTTARRPSEPDDGRQTQRGRSQVRRSYGLGRNHGSPRGRNPVPTPGAEPCIRRVSGVTEGPCEARHAGPRVGRTVDVEFGQLKGCEEIRGLLTGDTEAPQCWISSPADGLSRAQWLAIVQTG